MIPNSYTATKLRELSARMLQEPRRVNMTYWGAVVDPKNYDRLEEGEYTSEASESSVEVEAVLISQRPPCGAIGCMAGSLCIMEGVVKPSTHFNGTDIYEFDSVDTPNKAAEILRISKDEAYKLFYLRSWGWEFGWPKEFDGKLDSVEPGTTEYVQVIVDRIEHYITTGE